MAGMQQDIFGGQQSTGDKVWMQRSVIALGVLLLVLGIAWVVQSLMSGKVSTKKPVTTIKIMPDTPPPPPPPKEPPKEQPKEQPKEIKMEQPKPQEAPQPPAEALKMEGAAGDGPSPFAAGSVANDYKGGDVATKIGGGKSAYQFAFYTDQIKTLIEETLAKNKQLANGKYRVVIRIWLKPDGQIEKIELSGSSGDGATDKLIKTVLATMPPLQERPPEDMPQPVKLRITAKNAG